MDNRFIKLKHMLRSERENAMYYEDGRIIINLDHIISLVPHKSLVGYWILTMRDDKVYVVDHSIANHFPVLDDDYIEQSIFVCDICGINHDKNQ
jgi:hypothetical protein